MDLIQGFISGTIDFLAAVLVLMLGLGILLVAIVYVMDVTQTKTALLRNYPVIGHFRYFFEHLGEFFRQYFFAQDREELPFNRAQRSWVYRAAKNLSNTVAFGSTRDLRRVGTVMFVNSAFPMLDEEAQPPATVTIGPHCREPYTTNALVCISAMSFGALSRPAVEALSMGAAQAGIWLNTGEGGLSPHHLKGGCDLVFQIGTAKNGVRDRDGNLDDERLRAVAAYQQVKMFEIKLSQGAKPGKGGILPATKVSEEIAAIRHIPVGVAAISPNRHLEVKNNADLVDMIERVREVSGKPVGIKAAISDAAWLDDLFAEINARGSESAPDYIAVDGADGGTGAAPLALIDDMGLPLRESLPLLVDKLEAFGLRERVKVMAAGKLITPADVAWALCLGADFCLTARGFMFSLGCIQALQCNKNTCPTGITTHDPDLQKGLVPEVKKDRVAHFAKNIVHEVEVIAHSCGVSEPRQLKRSHARIVMDNTLSVRMDELYKQSTLNRK